jgi:hypothetical protein
MFEPSQPPPKEAHHADRRSGPPRWVAAGFLLAFGASILTVILTGLWVRSPAARLEAPAAGDAPAVTAPPSRRAWDASGEPPSVRSGPQRPSAADDPHRAAPDEQARGVEPPGEPPQGEPTRAAPSAE